MRAPHRVLDRLAGVALGVAFAAVAFAATPPLLILAGGPFAEALDAAGGPAPREVPHAPRPLFGDPEPAELDPEPEEADAIFDASPQSGTARGPLPLRKGPSEGSQVVGEVPSGRLVAIVSEVGDWALVIAGGEEARLVGWARKSGIAVR